MAWSPNVTKTSGRDSLPTGATMVLTIPKWHKAPVAQSPQAWNRRPQSEHQVDLPSLRVCLSPETHFLSPGRHFRQLMPWEEVQGNSSKKTSQQQLRSPLRAALRGLACHRQLGHLQDWGLQDLPRSTLSHHSHQNYNQTTTLRPPKNKWKFGCLLQGKPNSEAGSGGKEKIFYSESWENGGLLSQKPISLSLKKPFLIPAQDHNSYRDREGWAFFSFQLFC